MDRYIRLVDKYVPKVSEEARVYIARFPHKVGEVLKQVRKIRKKRARTGTNKDTGPLYDQPAHRQHPGELPLRLYPGENQQESLRQKSSEALWAMPTRNNSMILLQPWGGGSTEEEAQQPDTYSWPWGEAGRPSDRGESTGVLAEKPREPAGDPLPRHRSLSRSPDGARGGAQLTPNATWRGVQLVQAHMEKSRARRV